MTAVAQSHAYIDQFTAAAGVGSARLGRPVTCKAGCFHCCREPLWVEINEAREIAEQFTGEAREALTARTAVWWEKFFAGGFNKEKRYEQAEGPARLMRFLHAGIWCPVLLNGVCGAYTHRPSGCRMHNAVGSAIRCADLSKRPHQKFMQTDQDDTAMANSIRMLCEDAPTSFLMFDHLGVWLGHILLGKSERSASARDMIITTKEPQILMP